MAFGKVVKGMDVVRKIATFGMKSKFPKAVVRISGCGVCK